MKRASRRPRRNPIPPRDPSFLLDPYPWVEGTVLEDYCPEDDAGFFHVTTNRSRVFADGKLRSRADVGVIGLGGGQTDPGRHVSFVVNRSRALWLFSAMRGLLLACTEGDAASVLRLALEWTGFPGDHWSFNWDDWGDEEDGWGRQADDLADFCAELGLEPPDDIQSLAFGGPWEEMIERQADALNRKWATPERRYELAQFFETRLESTFYVPDWWDDGTCVPLVGFTASASRFLALDPKQFSICQAAIRAGAPYSEMVPRECELRFSPEDVQLVALDCQDENNVIPVPPRFED